jgi:hypothetical protein
MTIQMTYKDHEFHKLSVGPLSPFAGDDVPLLWRADNDLGVVDLFTRQLVVASQLGHFDAV